MKGKLTTFALALSAALAAGQASAYTAFFGEDLQQSSTVPLTSIPVSSDAQTAFLGGLNNAGVETFETQATGSTAPLGLTFPGATGNLTATLTGGNGIVSTVSPGTTDGDGRYSVPSAGSSNFWFVSVDTAGSFTINFNQDVGAFGFYGIDIGDAGGAVSLEFLDANGKAIAMTDVLGNTSTRVDIGNSIEGTDGSVLFFGLLASNANELFRSVRFYLTPSSDQGAITDGFAFDNFTVADSCQIRGTFSTDCSPGGGGGGGGGGDVPEPASLALVATALLGLRLSKTRRA